MIDAARELYLKYRGRQHERITSEMRENGWVFYRSMLYTTKHLTALSPGWIERFGWMEMLSPEDRKGLRKRNVGRNYFEAWLEVAFPEWTWRWKYQRYIYGKLARITKGSGKRLMIFMPPRHGKSELVTVRYTAWRLLQDPNLNVILGSYNQKLADKFSRKVKRIAGNAGSPACIAAKAANEVGEHSALGQRDAIRDARNAGGTGVAGEGACVPGFRRLNTASEWETHGGGVVRSVGVGAGIAGFGAGLIVIDDPVRNRADAESETYRDRVCDWFNDDIYTRMEPKASIILIQTRWHEDDLAGRLLKEMENGGEKWDVVRLPGLAETGNADMTALPKTAAIVDDSDSTTPNGSSAGRNASQGLALRAGSPRSDGDPLGRKPGHALCPQRFDAKTLLRYKKKLGSYSFSALYQQSPTPMEGGRFKRAWFTKIVDAAPPGLRWKRGYDLAVSTKTSADYTASFRCAYDRQGNLYVEGGFRRRIEYPEQRRYIVERMNAETITEHGIEAAMHGKAVVQELRRDRSIRRFAFREVRVTADKLTRALAWLNLAEEGKLILVRGPWIDEFIDEVCRFPNGRHDDQVDAVSVAVNMLGRNGVDKRLYVFD